MSHPFPKLFLSFMGIEANTTSHLEKIVSAVGGFIGILMVTGVSWYFLGPKPATLIVGSMGASAVLLFAVPHGALSQPWAVLGGHMISAAIGVTVVKLVPDPFIAAAASVGFAIGAMYYLRCIHPPGGATALTAAIGGPAVHAMGYQFVLTPVLMNVGIILATAFLVNYAFAWRRYPLCVLCRRQSIPAQEGGELGTDMELLSSEDIQYALKELDSYIDVTEEDLERIYALAQAHSHHQHLEYERIRLGGYYSNGKYGDHWSVRQIVDRSGETDPDKDAVIYKVVAGRDRRRSGTCSRREFAQWAKYEVARNENYWQRVDKVAAGQDGKPAGT